MVLELTLVTWNCWFSEFERPRRLEALLERVRRESPDVIALQELVPETHRQLLEVPWIRDGYYPSDAPGHSVRPYGTLLLSRRRPERTHIIVMPSRMGRRLVAMDLDLGDHLLRVGGIHLESLNSTVARKHQLGLIFPFLQEAGAAVLMGDMNFGADDPEQAVVPRDFLDVWPALHPEDPGYTRDPDANRMAFLHSHSGLRRRIDRVFMRAGSPGWTPKSIEILGTEPLDPGDPGVLPSDHYGLVVRLERAPPAGRASPEGGLGPRSVGGVEAAPGTEDQESE